MKCLLLISIFTSFAHATTIGQFISSPDGSSFQGFTVNGQKSTYEKRSNFFDSNKDLTLGEFELKAGEDLSKEEKALNAALSKIKDVDAFMKKKNSSFNELSSKKPHESYIVIDNYKVTKDSTLYPELKKVYDTLAQKEWKQESGIRLSDDFKTITIFKDSKEIKKEAFNFPFHCKNPKPSTVCGYKDLGILFVE